MWFLIFGHQLKIRDTSAVVLIELWASRSNIDLKPESQWLRRRSEIRRHRGGGSPQRRSTTSAPTLAHIEHLLTSCDFSWRDAVVTSLIRFGVAGTCYWWQVARSDWAIFKLPMEFVSDRFEFVTRARFRWGMSKSGEERGCRQNSHFGRISKQY